MDTTEKGRSIIITILIVIGFVVVMAVPSIITYSIMRKNITPTDPQTKKTATDIISKTEYKITSAVSTADQQREKQNHENLQKLIDSISTTIREYDSLSGK